ncbi:MAG: hypothetical protein OP8BY_0060 [Candidatus Saccharicenans subterraneus]|uniref:Uncharacterized protein n=1 Tax=Candidatus Saccharicenans subterraneus TaxID=2508984 RepID=A0A3E2BLQ6_9BACT|nr:MAG: hypothetical protein OP8BY_0060 [Candidatus Saccharicenans subterraneum]
MLFLLSLLEAFSRLATSSPSPRTDPIPGYDYIHQARFRPGQTRTGEPG